MSNGKRKNINERLREKRGLYDGIVEISRGASKHARGVIAITLPYVPTYVWLGRINARWWCWTVVFASQGLATWAITSERRTSGKNKFDNSG